MRGDCGSGCAVISNHASARLRIHVRSRILLDHDILAGKHTFDDFAFEVDEHGTLELSDDGKEVIEEALFLAASEEARGLPGYRGTIA